MFAWSGAHGRLTIKAIVFGQNKSPADELAFRRSEKWTCDQNFELIQKPIHRVPYDGIANVHWNDRDLFAIQTGKQLDASIDQSNAEALVNAGLVELDEKGLRTTNLGRLRLNGVIAALAPAFG